MYDLSGVSPAVSGPSDTCEFSNAPDERRPQRSRIEQPARPETALPATRASWTQKLETLALRDIVLDVTECVFGLSERKECSEPQDLDMFKIEQSTVLEAGQVRLAKASTIMKPVLGPRREGHDVRPRLALWPHSTAGMAKAA